MQNSKRFLILALAVLMGGGSFFVSTQSHAQGSPLVYLCYRGQTIQVQYYLKDRYIAKGAMNGPCETSGM